MYAQAAILPEFVRFNMDMRVFKKQTQASQFFTMETYQKLGYEICETFLDLIEKNPCSRINNPKNYFKSVKYVKMNLALSLLKMAPNRF